MKKYFSKLFAATLFMSVTMSAHAGMPVIDLANLGEAIAQVEAWSQQFSQMVQQITASEAQVTAITGSRNMLTALPNVQALRQVAPTASFNNMNTLSGAQAAATQSAAQLTSATGRVAMLTSMINSIDGTADTKASLDLANRIKAEHAFLQNEATMLQAGKDNQAAQAAVQAQIDIANARTLVHGSTAPGFN